MNTGSKKLQREVGSTFCGAQVKFDPLYDLAYFNLAYALLGQDRQMESDAAFREFHQCCWQRTPSRQEISGHAEVSRPAIHGYRQYGPRCELRLPARTLRVTRFLGDLVPSLHSGSPRQCGAPEVLSRRPVPAHQHQ